MSNDSNVALALDVGGTKILAAAIRPDGQLLALTERATNAAGGRDAVLAAMAAALAALPRDLPPAVGLGISAAGVIDPVHACVADATDAMPGWAGTDLRAHFGALLGLPVHALNDVQAALLGELAWGALAGQPQVDAVMLTLGTGLGGALALQGRIHTGRGFIAGHFGRTLLRHGEAWRTVESLVSGTGLANLYRELGGTLATDAGARGVLREPLDAIALQALDLWVEHLAVQLTNLHWSLSPEVVLLGGGLLDARALWWPRLEARLAAQPAPPVIAAQLGSRAGVFGAARHLFDALKAVE